MVRPPARLSVILARRRPIAAVFRRGPSRWVCVLRWRTDTDEVEAGDWFRGRLYSRRCDLSPDGLHLVYFAAAFGAGLPGLDLAYSWTAVSRLPSLQPSVSWTKDHCWFGGGLFDDDYRLWVNEPPPPDPSAGRDTFALTFNDRAGGEDEPVYAPRLARDGWTLTQSSDIVYVGHGFTTHRPELRRKSGPRGAHLEMSRSIEGFAEVDRYALELRGGARFDLDVSWADFDQAGRLVGAREGLLLELRPDRHGVSSHLIADLNAMHPPRSASGPED